MRRRALLVLALALGTSGAAPAAGQSACSGEPFAVQVLGSGGPYAGGGRASSGYLIWRNGKAVALIDVGGGTFLRFGEAGGKLDDLLLIGLTHLHPDHVADLPALLWLSEQVRQRPLPLVGPTGAGAFPPVDLFVRRLFDSTSGAFPVLRGAVGQRGQGVLLEPRAVDATVGRTTTVTEGDLVVKAIGVPHANVPSLAYRIEAGGRSIVIGADQNGSDPAFATFAAGADVLVLHFALSTRATGPLTQLHATPAVVGQVAAAARAKRLVLSHLIDAPKTVAARPALSLSDLEPAVAAVRAVFTGPVEVATDLHCVPAR